MGVSTYRRGYEGHEVEQEFNLHIRGLSIAYEKDKFNFYSEYYLGKQGAFSDSSGSIDVLKKSGFYAQTSCKISNWEALVRFDYSSTQGHDLEGEVGKK